MPSMLDLNGIPPSLVVGGRLAVIVVAALLGYAALRSIVRLGERHVLERRARDAGADAVPDEELDRRVRTIGTLAVRIAGGVIAVIAVLMALDLFGIDIGPAVAGLGVAGIAVGFGAQTLVRDWLAGIFIVLENQYNTGDVVRIAGVEGTVEDFSLRRTTLRDLDGTVHTVPNGQITVASNMTRLWARVNLDIRVPYNADIDRATALINRVGEELRDDPAWAPRLLEPPSVVRVSALADSAVALKVLGQVRPAEQWAVAGELRKRILAAFSAEGIDVPFPHQVIVSRETGGGPAAVVGPAEPSADAGDPTEPVGPNR